MVSASYVLIFRPGGGARDAGGTFEGGGYVTSKFTTGPKPVWGVFVTVQSEMLAHFCSPPPVVRPIASAHSARARPNTGLHADDERLLHAIGEHAPPRRGWHSILPCGQVDTDIDGWGPGGAC